MKLKLFLCLFVLTCMLLSSPTPTFATRPEAREKQLEEALLQQLHSVIVASLKTIYSTEFATYSCERISSINELITQKIKDEGSIRVDAIHGAKYFEISVSLCSVGGKKDDVELYLKNDSPTADYYMVGYRIAPKD